MSVRRISLDEQQAARKVRAPAPRIKDLLPTDHSSRMPTEEEKEKLIGACIKFCNSYPQLSYVTCPENWRPEGVIARWCAEHNALPTFENLTACLQDVPEAFRYDLDAAGINGYGIVDGSTVLNLPSKLYAEALWGRM